VPLGWRRSQPATSTDVEPQLRLRAPAAGESVVVPAVIELARLGKTRLGGHPPFMDAYVGHADFSRLPWLDIRGEEEAIRDLSRHAACLWREATGACFVQLGWPGPGEVIRPRDQTRVLRLGRPQDATNQPFRLRHRDVLRLATAIEYVYVELAPPPDRVTPEQKKIAAFEASLGGGVPASAKLGLVD
jgi:hypothetical protein